MLNGIVFYWVSWLIWILLTFFRVYRYNRYIIMSWLFLLMITFSSYINIFGYDLSIAFFLLLIGSMVLYIQSPISFRFIFVTFTIMIAYLTLRIWEIMAPIWFFMPSIILIPLIISLGTIILINEFTQRISQMLLGISIGELFYSLILNGYYLNNVIVSSLYFDYLAVMVLIILCLQIMRYIWFNIIQTMLTINRRFLFKN